MKMIGLARLGRDAELRTTQQGESVATLALAFSYGRKGEDGKRPSEWVKASLWGQRAQALHQYLIKGAQVSVTLDDPHIETYSKADGSPGYSLVCRVNDIEFAGGTRQDSEQQAPRQAAPQQRQAPQQYAAPQQRQPAPQQRQAAPSRQSASTGSGFDDMDDDIPF